MPNASTHSDHARSSYCHDRQPTKHHTTKIKSHFSLGYTTIARHYVGFRKKKK